MSPQGSCALPEVKYRLPSDPDVWVDVLDEADVQLMLEEWRDGAVGTNRLHVFVQWGGRISAWGTGGSKDAPLSGDVGEGEEEEGERGGEGDGEGASLLAEARGAAADRDRPAPASPARAPASPPRAPGSRSRAPSARSPLSPAAGGRRAGSRSPPPAGTGTVDMASMLERMEILRVQDVVLTRFLGAGGYGDVYLGQWHSCEVAVKCLSPSFLFQAGQGQKVNPAAALDLIREADVMSRLRHPNVVWVFGLVLPDLLGARTDGQILRALSVGAQNAGALPGTLRPPALVVEYMSGGSLRAALSARAEALSAPGTRVLLALDVARGMAYLHGKSIIHFDLKSGNVLLSTRDKRPVCKVADLGLCKRRRDTYASGVTAQRGTLPYTAPEVLRTPGQVTEKADVYSFGVLLWELWTGKEPYEGQNYHALLHQLSQPNTRLRPPLPQTPEWEDRGGGPRELAPGWAALVESCWAEDPDQRPGFPEIVKTLRDQALSLKHSARSRAKALPAAAAPPRS